ncbi:MAG: hypothetical protein KDE27_11710 [Planctomycetes bacterium]|nr:hypothetical protein [Planctomycetota bacterium]
MRGPSVTVAFLQAGLLAQTFIVDAGNGPGTSFTSLVAAAAAVPDGAILLVRAGAYAGFQSAAKGLVVLGEPGVTITGAIQLGPTSAAQAIVLRDLDWAVPTTSQTTLVTLTRCDGPVLLERITTPAYPCGLGPATNCAIALSAESCRQLAVRDCTLHGGVELWKSLNQVLPRNATSFEHCVLVGHGAPETLQVSPALHAGNTDVEITSSILNGGDGSGTFPAIFSFNASAITVSAAQYATSLRVLDSTITGGLNPSTPSYAVEGHPGEQATLRVDPGSGLTGVTASTNHITAQSLVMPRLTATSAAPGGTLTAVTSTENGDFVALAIGLRATPTMLPGFADAFWLDPLAHATVAIGVQQNGASVGGAVQVPNASGFVGLQLAWHAVCFGPVTGQQNSNPAISLIHG